MNKPKNPVKSVQTTIDLLTHIKENGLISISELAESMNMSRGGIHNHLSTLEANGFVSRNDNGKFEVGLRLFEFGAATRRRQHIYLEGAKEVDRLAKEAGDLGSLLVEEQGRGIYLYRARGVEALNLDTGIGSRVYLHNTGLGKAILSNVTEDRLNEIIDVHGLPATTPNTITEKATLLDELEQIREKGYAIDDEERTDGVRCVAAPIQTNNGRVLGAVSIAGPISRMSDNRLESEIPEMVQNAAKSISINASYIGQSPDL